MRYLPCTLFALVSFNAYANVFQYFTGITYNNPAELFKVAQSEFIFGGTGFNVAGQFNGLSLNFNTLQQDYGSSVTQNVNVLPFGRIAKRINKQLVLGVDVTEPFNSNLYWGRNSVTRYVSTETLITDIDVSPRFSFNAFPKLFIGAGLNFNFLKNNETNWALPTGPSSYSTLVNRSSSFALGYDVGAYYLLDDNNFVGAVYYSSLPMHTRGTSTFNGNVRTDLAFNFSFPATTVFSYVHLFSPAWLVNFQVFRSEWNINQAARYYNTAALPPSPANFIFPTRYKQSWAYNAAVRHQFTEKLGLTAIGLADFSPERDNLRPVNFPSDTIYFLALAADYHVTKSTSLELLYGHGFLHTLINNQISLTGTPQPLTTGNIHFNVDVVDLRIKVQM